jgi:putative ABC transport system permease protein
VRPVARLAPGVSVQEADAELQVVVRRLQQAYPETNRVMGAGLMPLRGFLIKGIRGPLLVLLGAVGLLLVLACTNVANLVLVRASERGREVAVRRALGAGRGRVAGLMLVEALVVSTLGGVLGLGLGWLGVRGFTGLADLGIEGATTVTLDHRVVLFTAGTSIVAALVFSLAPIVRNARGGRLASLAGGERSGADVGGLRVARSLVGVEVALALLLVVGAGLMVRSFWFLRDVDPGFEADGVLAVGLSVPSSRYAARDDVLAFYDRLLAALEARPGIERAGTVGQLPLSGTSWSSQFQAEGWPPERVGFEILHRRADAGYFEALRIPLIRGRLLQDTDGPDDPFVVVINEIFAREHFPNEDPLGQRIAYDRAADESSTWREIVGIVGDQSQVSPREPARAEVFESRYQDWGRDNWVVVRTGGDALAALTTVREALRELDPLIPIARAQPLREVWRTSMAREELILSLLAAFGGLALVLAAVGVYGVTAQAARKRTREIGVRMALGADRGDVVRLLFRQGLGAVVMGLVLGLIAALAATRAMTSLLYQVRPGDPATLAGVVALLGLVAALACYLPARRATRLDPVASLRAE